MLDEDLAQIEESIRRLQIEWEKFFAGLERKPPHELRGRLEALIRKHAHQHIRNSTDRFRYQTLTARYNTFNEMWNKRLRAMEEGRSWTGVRPPAAAPAAPAAPPQKAARPDTPFRVAGAASDGGAIRALYESFMEARKAGGEAGAVKFEAFEGLIAKQASRILTEQGARAVDFRLESKDGKVSLKAKPVK
jgi:hypothetical protein